MSLGLVGYGEEGMYFKEIVVEALSGADIGEAIRIALRLSAKYEVPIRFEFNGVTVVVDCKDMVEGLYRKWHSDMHSEDAKPKAAKVPK